MIIVKNRELLIPRNEQYIGTPNDNNADNRVFRISRLSQTGEDLSGLTYRLDLLYPDKRNVYTVSAVTSRSSRSVVVLTTLFSRQYPSAGTYTFSFNGTDWKYNNQNVRLSEVGIIIGYTPVSGDTVTVTSTIRQVTTDTVVLSKEITEDYINLTWTVTAAQLAIPGTVYVTLRGANNDAQVRWASFQGAFYVEQNNYTPAMFTGPMSELEYFEQVLSSNLVKLEYLPTKYEALELAVENAEAWAKGTRSGSAVPQGDDTYHNNSKYYSEQANASKNAAANSQNAAAASAALAAQTVANLNAQFQNAMAALTVDSELQNIRVGADNVTYPSAGEAVRTQVTNLKSALNDQGSGIFDSLYASDYLMLPWMQGSINPNNGKGTSEGTAGHTTHVRTDGFMPFNAPAVAVEGGGLKIRIFEYTESEHTYIGQVTPGYVTGTYIFVPVEGHAYRLTASRADDSNITPSDTALNSVTIRISKSVNDVDTSLRGIMDPRFSKWAVSPNLFNSDDESMVVNPLRLKSDGTFEANAKGLGLVCPVNGTAGDSFTFNFVNIDTSALQITAFAVGASQTVPKAGSSSSDVGTVNFANARGYVTLTKPCQYIFVTITFNSAADKASALETVKNALIIARNSSSNITYPAGYYDFIAPLANRDAVPYASGVRIDASNKSKYFDDFNNAPLNSIYSIAIGTEMLNAPDGNNQLNYDDQTPGYFGGTLITFGAEYYKNGAYRTQLFLTHSTNETPRFVDTCICARHTDTNGSWSPWVKFDSTMMLKSANIVIRESTAYKFFTDLNDAPDNAVYQIDLDCVDGVLANHPYPGHSCVLQTVHFSNSGYFGRYQLVVGLESVSSMKVRAFIRYGYQASGAQWTKWAEITNDGNRGELASGTNLNNVLTDGYMLLNSANTYTNSPLSAESGILLVMAFGDLVYQKVEKLAESTYLSRYSADGGQTWSAWI